MLVFYKINMKKENKKIQNQIYIIEHLEPKLFDWCIIEYEHISQTVGKKNLWFTNIKNKKDQLKLKRWGMVFVKKIKDININLKQACILDPQAKETLKPKDLKKYRYYIFGGILGDYPPKKRTTPELTRFLKEAGIRNIGKPQMSTDNAVYTVKKILGGNNFKDLKFKDNISLKLGKFEFVDLPYRYNLVRGKPFMSKKIKNYLFKKGAFR
jgi:ribosome biogenesis SPOUT family RNA methylase Rps3